MLGILVSLGFAVVFSVTGVLISYFGSSLLKYARWIDLFIGILLVVTGIVYFFNWKIGISKLATIGENIKANKLKNKYLSFFLYGIGFAIASLGCTLPIFLLVVTAGIKASGFLNGLFVFLIYAAGMSLFMVSFSVATALSKTVIEKTLRRWLPYIYKLGFVVVIIAGLYLIYNQIVLGKLFG